MDESTGVMPDEIRTARLHLRQIQDVDLPEFAAMNADPEVMEFFPGVWTEAECAVALAKIRQAFSSRGFGVYAVEADGEFAGIVGLWVPEFEAAFTPCVEILWRLARPFWGRGYASEAAKAVMDLAFERLALTEVLAFTVAGNERSMRVMEKIGMRRDFAGDFDHPLVVEEHLKRHVLFRVRAPQKNQ